MSVLIADSTLVVRKAVIEAAYPGGITEFVRTLEALDKPPQFICTSDEHLVSASFAGRGITSAFDALGDFGETMDPTTESRNVVYMHQLCGDFGHGVPWLKWRLASGVLTYAWLAGTEPGDVAMPAGWVPREVQAVNDEATRPVRSGPITPIRDMAVICAALGRPEPEDLALDEPVHHFELLEPHHAYFVTETRRAWVWMHILTGGDGGFDCTCKALTRAPVRDKAALQRLVDAANLHGLRGPLRVHYRMEQVRHREFEYRACFRPDELTVTAVQTGVDEAVKFAEEVKKLARRNTAPRTP